MQSFKNYVFYRTIKANLSLKAYHNVVKPLKALVTITSYLPLRHMHRAAAAHFLCSETKII